MNKFKMNARIAKKANMIPNTYLIEKPTILTNFLPLDATKKSCSSSWFRSGRNNRRRKSDLT